MTTVTDTSASGWASQFREAWAAENARVTRTRWLTGYRVASLFGPPPATAEGVQTGHAQDGRTDYHPKPNMRGRMRYGANDGIVAAREITLFAMTLDAGGPWLAVWHTLPSGLRRFTFLEGFRRPGAAGDRLSDLREIASATCLGDLFAAVERAAPGK